MPVTRNPEKTDRGQQETDGERGLLTHSESRKANEASGSIEYRIDSEESSQETEILETSGNGGGGGAR